MKTHPGAARVLALPALAALLALLGGARAACGPRNTPKITVKNKDDAYLKISYGEDLIIHCSAKNTVHLSIEENRKHLQIMEVNTTTIQLCVKKRNLGSYTYSCVDGETGCEDSVTVNVIPAMSVESPKLVIIGMKSRGLWGPRNRYLVPLGEDFEVFCSGHDSEALSIKLNDEDGQLKTVINSTSSIKYRTKVDSVQETSYYCYGKVTTTGEEHVVYDRITVTVDYYPEYHNFGCVIYMFHVLECSWNYSGNIISYQLFYTDATKSYLDTPLCDDKSGDVATGACKVDEYSTGNSFFVQNQNMSLLLLSCSRYLCKNQSISVSINAITKPDPPYYFAVLNTSVHGVALTWSYWNYVYLAQKVEYRQIKLDDDWRVADLSSLRCHAEDFADQVYTCECRLALPYPDAEYEVRVYCRHETATDDRVWSNPKSLLVTTKPRVQECACSAAPETPAEPTTISAEGAEAVSCEVCMDTEDIIKQSLALKKKLRSMKEKIKRITNLIQVNKLLNNLD